MRRSARPVIALALAAVLTATSPAPADAGVVSSVGGVLSGVGGALLGVGKTVLCTGLSAGGTVASGASTVAGGVAAGAESGGAGAAAGAAAGSAVGGVIKKGVGAVTNVLCSNSSSGVLGAVAKTAAGAVAAAATFDLAAHWIITAAQKITQAIVSAITTTTSPDLASAWFAQSFAPMAASGGALALLVTLIALASAAARRNPAVLAGTLTGVVRAGVGTGLLIALTTLALQVSDAISADVIESSHQTFWAQVAHAWGQSGFGGFGSSALAMLMAIAQVLAGVIVWLELAVRNAAIYLAVLFFPVALAASIWPNLAGWSSRLARLLFLFVILKPVTLIVLAFAGNAALAGLAVDGGLGSAAGRWVRPVAPWARSPLAAAVVAGRRAPAGFQGVEAEQAEVGVRPDPPAVPDRPRAEGQHRARTVPGRSPPAGRPQARVGWRGVGRARPHGVRSRWPPGSTPRLARARVTSPRRPNSRPRLAERRVGGDASAGAQAFVSLRNPKSGQAD